MNLTLSVTCSSDWARLTLGNGIFIVDDTPWHVRHDALAPVNPVFDMTASTSVLTINKTQNDFNQITIETRVQVPDGTPYLNVTVGRGGVGSLHLECNTIMNGTADPEGAGDFALPL